MQQDTAIVPLREGLTALVQADGMLGTWLTGRKVFAGLATKGASLPYLTIAQILIDRQDGYYGQPGRFHKRRLTIWTKLEATLGEDIYARLVTILDGQLFIIDGHTMQHAELSCVGGPSPDDLGAAWGTFCDWSVRTLSGAVV